MVCMTHTNQDWVELVECESSERAGLAEANALEQ